MSATAVPDRFTLLPDEHTLQATVVALEEHGFGVEVVGDLDVARQAVRNQSGAPVDHAVWGGIQGLAVKASRMASMGRRPWLRALMR